MGKHLAQENVLLTKRKASSSESFNKDGTYSPELSPYDHLPSNVEPVNPLLGEPVALTPTFLLEKPVTSQDPSTRNIT